MKVTLLQFKRPCGCTLKKSGETFHYVSICDDHKTKFMEGHNAKAMLSAMRDVCQQIEALEAETRLREQA